MKTLTDSIVSVLLCAKLKKKRYCRKGTGRVTMRMKMHQPGFEPGSSEWESLMLPLHHWCCAHRAMLRYFIYLPHCGYLHFPLSSNQLLLL